MMAERGSQTILLVFQVAAPSPLNFKPLFFFSSPGAGVSYVLLSNTLLLNFSGRGSEMNKNTQQHNTIDA